MNSSGTNAVKTTAERSNLRNLVQIGMLGAVSVVLMMFEIPLFFAPSFYKIDLSEIPVLIGTFAMGPVAGMFIELIKVVLHMLFKGSSTAGVGDFANFLIGCAMIVPAGLIYQKKKSKKSAVIGMIAGTLFMAFIGCFLNAFVLLPASSSWFTRPAGIFVEAEVCRKSGHLKGRFCDETDTLLVLPAGLRTEACPYHHLVTLSANESQRIYENCANTEPTHRKSWFTLPPVWEWYYTQHHPEYKPLPPFKAGCGEDTFQPMQFIYPPMNARIKLPKQLDGSKGFLTVELAHNNPNATVFWHLDETYQAQTQDFHKISLQPAAGKHSLTAVDGEGNTISTTFFVE